ncbi:MAG: NUDIX domain-containing protein [Ruminococcus sp.]|nr:NUDIX domain-containing protein [Ruminococcus sp.]
MRYKYCPECGKKLTLRPVGDEGDIPCCDACDRPWFDTFSTCVLSVPVNEKGEVLLIRQSYGDTSRFVGVAGFMKPNETAENAASREILEETGLKADRVTFLESLFYEGRDQLMLGFMADVKKGSLTLSGEVAQGEWFDIDTAIKTVRQGSIIQKLIINVKENFYENS